MDPFIGVLKAYGLVLIEDIYEDEPYVSKSVTKWFKENWEESDEHTLEVFLDYERDIRNMQIAEPSYFKKRFGLNKKYDGIPNLLLKYCKFYLEPLEEGASFEVQSIEWRDTLLKKIEKDIMQQPEFYGFNKKEFKIKSLFNDGKLVEEKAREVLNRHLEIIEGDEWEDGKQQFHTELLKAVKEIMKK